MSKLEKAVAQSGVFPFVMMYKPDFPIEFICENPFSDKKHALFGDIIHPDDYQPFCEIIEDVVANRSENLSAHSRMLCGDSYHWFYISAKPDFKNGTLREINGVMYDVTIYLDCEGEDLVMHKYREKSETSFSSVKNAPSLLTMLGEDYLRRIQQPFSFIEGLYSQITDGDTVVPAAGQGDEINLNKMNYQRKKYIRIKHQDAASWVIASESPEDINKCASLLDVMVQTVSELANSYLVISDEMENSQKANKLLGENFEDQILINNIYSLVLKSTNTTASFGSVIPLIKEYFGLEQMYFCADAQKPVRIYYWDDTGSIIPMNLGGFRDENIDKELEADSVVCKNEDELRADGKSKSRSCALSRIYENGTSRGVIVLMSPEKDRVWTNRERKLIRNITQIISTVLYRSFMENELAVSQENLLRLAYYNTTTGIPNRSAFERDFRENITAGKTGAVIAVEIKNLKDLSELYSTRYADEVTRSIAEYISAIHTEYRKHIYLFDSDTLFVTLDFSKREDAISLAQSILFKFRSPWYLNDNENRLDIYASVCMYPDDADCVPDCVRVATKTLRLAKERNLHDAVCYSGDIEEKLDDNQRVRKLITDALENDFKGFYYLYAPILDIETGKLDSCEAHLFWSNDDIIVSRDRFLPIVDRMNMQFEFHRFALGRICKLCSEVRKNGISDFRVGYTIPDNILNSENSLVILRERLDEFDLPADAIAIYVSETDRTMLINNENLKTMSRMGVKVIADDKGEHVFTGDFLDNPYVSLLMLRSRRLSDDPVAASFARSIIKRAHEKGIKVCIKGVDNEKALENSKSFDADLYQGIVNSRPLHTTDFIKKLVVSQNAKA